MQHAPRCKALGHEKKVELATIVAVVGIGAKFSQLVFWLQAAQDSDMGACRAVEDPNDEPH